MPRSVGWVLVLVAVIAAIALGFRSQPLPIEVMEVSRGPMQVVLEEEGRTRVIDRFEVSAPVAGHVRRIELDVGDPVASGDILAAIEPLASQSLDPRSRAEAEALVAAAEAALRSSRETAVAVSAEARFARADWERIEKLFASETMSREQLERAEAEDRRTSGQLRSAEFSIDVARHELAAAKTALEYSARTRGAEVDQVVVRSTVGGRILRIMRQSEGVVLAGQPLIEIGDPSTLEVVVEVLSVDAVRIATGARVLFERWGGDAPLEGRVRVVEPVGFTKVSALGVEEQRVLVICDITAPRDQWRRLGDGYRVQARFVLWEGEDVLRVPTSALFRRNGGWAAFRVADGRADQVEVEIKRRSGLVAEVGVGLTAGEVVITHPDETIADGVRVRSSR